MLTEISMELEKELNKMIKILNDDQKKITNDRIGMLQSNQTLNIYLNGNECVWYDDDVDFDDKELINDYDHLIEAVGKMMAIYDCFGLDKNNDLIDFYFRCKSIQSDILHYMNIE